MNISSRLFSFLFCARDKHFGVKQLMSWACYARWCWNNISACLIFRHQRECLAGVLTGSSHRSHSRKPPRDENEWSFFISLFVVLEDSIFSYHISALQCAHSTVLLPAAPTSQLHLTTLWLELLLANPNPLMTNWSGERVEVKRKAKRVEPQQVVRLLGSLISSLPKEGWRLCQN